MSNKFAQIASSILGGAGIGAALMYIFDPDQGKRRREYIADHAQDIAGNAWDTVSNQARNIGSTAADYTSSAANATRDTARSLYDSARDVASGWLGRASDATAGARDRASDFLDDASDWGNDQYQAAKKSYKRGITRAASALGAEQHGISVAGAAFTALTTLAIGAGLMYLLDPKAGAQRRRMVRDKTMDAARQTGSAVSSAAQTVGRKMSDAYESVTGKAKAKAEELAIEAKDLSSHVMHELNQRWAGNSIHADVEEGRVKLTGYASSNDVENILSVVRSIPGVIEVDNQLEMRDMAGR